MGSNTSHAGGPGPDPLRERPAPGAGGGPERDAALRLIATNPMPVLTLSGGRVAEANAAALTLFDTDAATLRGAEWSDLSAQREGVADLEALVRRLRAPAGVVSEVFPWSARRPSGVVVETEVALSLSGSPTEWRGLAVLRDVTQRRSLEGALRQAHKMELLGQLTGGVAHDFNNLLTAIDGNLEMAGLIAARGGDVTRVVATARECADRAAKLSRRLLDFSRTGVFRSKPEPVPVLLDSVAEFVRPLIRADIRIVVDATDAEGMLDRDQIEQVLLNLVLNAEAAMPDGGQVTLRCRSERVEHGADVPAWLRPGDYVRIEVEDSGIGIAPEIRDRIFEPFFSTRQGGRGGLGLSIVYGVVKQHRGFVGVDSERGRGSRFWLLLPAVGVRDASSATAAERAGREQVGAGVPTVLVVDDEPVVLDLAATALSLAGYRVVSAGTAEDAERLFAASDVRIDLLVTDLILTEASGRELADRLRAARPDLKVIYTSGYDLEQLSERLSPEAGADFLEKPYTLRSLTGRVRNLLES